MRCLTDAPVDVVKLGHLPTGAGLPQLGGEMLKLLMPLFADGYAEFAISKGTGNQIGAIRIATRRREKINVETGITPGGF